MAGRQKRVAGNPSRTARSASIALSLGINLGLAALLLWPHPPSVRAESASLAMFDVPPGLEPALPATSKPPQPKPVPPTSREPIVVPPPIVPLPAPDQAVIALLEQSDATLSGGACDLTAPVQAALQASKELQASLPQIPRTQRSVANAIMVWNVDWVALDAQLDTAALTIVRDVVAQTVAAASPECRLQAQGGPRLILLPGSADTTVLALGSGSWRWQDLLETARPGSSEEEERLASANHADVNLTSVGIRTTPLQ